jgi:hypothetical protein
VQIPDSHSVAEDTMTELRIRGFPLAFDRELASKKAKATGQGDEPSSNY